MDKPATTKVRCPKCKSKSLFFVESGTWSSEFTVVDGVFDRSDGQHEPDSIDRLDARCAKCRHLWKPRGANSINDVTELLSATPKQPE